MFEKVSLICVLVLAVVSVQAYKDYQAYIPNGNRVPNPCKPGTIWQGVGHEDHQGGGPRNPFGSDFFKVQKKWTVELCQMDSDGDGKTNGEELGDPDCVWSMGQTPAVTDQSKLSHPGLCEPLTSPKCQANNAFLMECEATGLTTPKPDSWCPAIKGEGVMELSLTFNKAKLTAEETQYVCKDFNLPNDDDYQIIAWQPIIDNREILHHMLIYACEFDLGPLENTTVLPRPQECRMIPMCGAAIVAWAFGISGQCYPNSVGAPFGKNYYHKIILQHHYNNEGLKPGYVDSSGIRLWYTKLNRPNLKGLVGFGESFLIIPPKTPMTEITSVFTTSCSVEQFKMHDRYYLLSMLLHVHKLANYGLIVLDKKKAGYKVVIMNETLTYDRPYVATWNAPYEILFEPGDELHITIRFDSTHKDVWTFFGSQTNDEMIFAFIDVYPRPKNANFMMPAGMGPLDYCEVYGPVPEGKNWTAGGCDFYAYNDKMGLRYGVSYEKSNATVEMYDVCQCTGADNYPSQVCSSECYAYMQRMNLFNEPCIANDPIFQLAMRPWFDDSEHVHRVYSQMEVCRKLKQPPPHGTKCDNPKTVDPTDGPVVTEAPNSAASCNLATVNLVAAVLAIIQRFF